MVILRAYNNVVNLAVHSRCEINGNGNGTCAMHVHVAQEDDDCRYARAHRACKRI